jgi:hypothetical protein
VRVRFATLATVVAGCFHPTPARDVPCSTDFHCPGAQLCDRGATPPVCVDVLGDAGGRDAIADTRGDDAPRSDGTLPDGPVHTIPDGAALWYRFDGDPAAGVVDSIGGHTGTCGTDCPALVAGKFGAAYKFNGQMISTPSAADLQPNGGFTVAVWARVDAAPGGTYGDFICKQQGGTDASYCLAITTALQPNFYTNGTATLNTPAIALGEWHHYAMTWDGATKLAYVDGARAASADLGAVPADSGVFQVGAEQDNTKFQLDGALDDLVFYDAVLSGAQIMQLAQP